MKFLINTDVTNWVSHKDWFNVPLRLFVVPKDDSSTSLSDYKCKIVVNGLNEDEYEIVNNNNIFNPISRASEILVKIKTDQKVNATVKFVAEVTDASGSVVAEAVLDRFKLKSAGLAAPIYPANYDNVIDSGDIRAGVKVLFADSNILNKHELKFIFDGNVEVVPSVQDSNDIRSLSVKNSLLTAGKHDSVYYTISESGSAKFSTVQRVLVELDEGSGTIQVRRDLEVPYIDEYDESRGRPIGESIIDYDINIMVNDVKLKDKVLKEGTVHIKGYSADNQDAGEILLKIESLSGDENNIFRLAVINPEGNADGQPGGIDFFNYIGNGRVRIHYELSFVGEVNILHKSKERVYKVVLD
ncbi:MULTISPECIES: hypothetical protein [Photorhabdus]|uniref:Uncharacterized protein n=1 Tax=Photorhabdus thracensis TaxID=230089 RepID=A0A0F7LUV0_9GAMM|nr:hypothetical protein [Photorhabdus thracensis]AKH65607.1 hypothetical protein VY86_21865 [Photorhabdus thracensis]MCC8422899.1 hypothetical protein [Photorhabdus thracensis]